MPALGLAASLLVAAVAVGVLRGPGGMDEAQTQRAPGDGGTAAAPEVAPGPIPPTDEQTLPGRRDRRVERQASLVLVAAPERIGDVSDAVIRLTDRAGGIVASSSVQSGDDDRGSATFALRVPAARLTQTLAELSRLAHVRARIQSFQDVTAGYVSAQERLRESLAQRSSLLSQLARADTAREAESVRARVAIVNRQIASTRGELSRARERTGYASIGVTIEPEGRDSSSDGTPGDWTARDALGDALRVLEVTAGVAIVTTAALVPIALIGAGAWLTTARLRRSRREGALNGD